jgi:hypothetical protein
VLAGSPGMAVDQRTVLVLAHLDDLDEQVPSLR